MTITFGSLFAGIGGFDLGFERAGMTCKWQVEIDPYCQRVLSKHWPHVPRHDDVRTFPPSQMADWSVDVVCGGFPCQDISNANVNAVGITGSRSGLWNEFFRIIDQIRPRYVVIENVRELTFRGLDVVLNDLASIGFDAEWQTISKWYFGSHDKRKRIYIVANRSDTNSFRWEGGAPALSGSWSHAQFTGLVRGVLRAAVPAGSGSRVSDGIPRRLDRLRGCGNAVTPQVAEWIGQQLSRCFPTTVQNGSLTIGG